MKQANTNIAKPYQPDIFLKECRGEFSSSRMSLKILDLTPFNDIETDSFPYHYLSWAERNSLTRFSMQKRKIEWYGGRICAKTALADLGSSDNCINPAEIVISNTSSGRPFAVLPSSASCGTEKHDISISHSSGIACAAAATSFCGIDIQEPKETLIRVYDRFCLKHEEDLLLSSLKDSGRIDSLTLLWAAKESIRKACSHSYLPKFLEISLQSVDSYGVSYRLLFGCRDQQFIVLGCFHMGYGLAFCLIKGYHPKE